MFVVICLYICAFVNSVQPQNQFQRIQSYPFTKNYGNVYGSQPFVVPVNSFNQQYLTQNHLIPRTPSQQVSISDQLQNIYLSKILSNPAIQAFIDPNTKIYNQNGVEISNQIRPRGTSSIVNNYFIVPTDYLKVNESRVKQKNVQDNRKSYSGQQQNNRINNEEVNYKSKNILNSVPNSIHKQEAYRPKKDYKGRKQKRVQSNLQDKNVMFDGQSVKDDKRLTKTTNNKRRDKIVSKLTNGVVAKDNINDREGIKKKVTENNNKNIEDKIIKNNNCIIENSELKPSNLDDNVNNEEEVFDIGENCCELDNRCIRNPVNDAPKKDTKTKSSKNQNDFMRNWMDYVKSFLPDQNFDTIDFSKLNFPYNFEQMYQMPNFRTGITKPNKTKKKRKQKTTKLKDVTNSKNSNDRDKKKTVELVPKFIEIESVETFAKPAVKEVTKSITKVEMEPKVQPPNERYLEEIESKILKSTESDGRSEQTYKKIDYYPDFTRDAIYTTDEDDLYFFHNRHYYNTDEKELSRERRKYGHEDKLTDVPNGHTKEIIYEDTKFRTPPGLHDPGFQTRQVDVKDNGFYTYYTDDQGTMEDRPVENNVETVFARSKVVKYGQQRNPNDIPTVLDHEHKEEYRNPYAKDGDRTVVFSKAWN